MKVVCPLSLKGPLQGLKAYDLISGLVPDHVQLVTVATCVGGTVIHRIRGTGPEDHWIVGFGRGFRTDADLEQTYEAMALMSWNYDMGVVDVDSGYPRSTLLELRDELQRAVNAHAHLHDIPALKRRRR